MKTIDAGTALLAAVVATNGEALDDIRVIGDDFPEPTQGQIYDAAVKLRQAGKAVDTLTLSDAVPQHLQPAVLDLLTWTHVSYNVAEYAEIIERHGVRRRIAEAGAAMAAFPPDMETAEMVDKAQSMVADVATKSIKPTFKFIRELVDDAILESVDDGSSFIESPWEFLNKAIGGFRPGAMYVVAARPGVGKTVVAAQIATAIADHGPVAFSSLEMSNIELAQRFIAERTMVSVRNIKNRRLTDRDLNQIASKRQLLDGLNIAIDDRANVSPADVRGFARALRKHAGGLAGVVVDYMQLMSSPRQAERHALVTEFSRQMKIMAKDMQVPVIVLSQLNRASESRADGIPKISDLRESGAIEQDADVCLLLRREGEDPDERLIIDVAKNRHGETGEVELSWQGMYSRAVDM